MNIKAIMNSIDINYEKYVNSPREYDVEEIESNWIQIRHLSGSIVDYQIYEDGEIWYQVDNMDDTDPHRITHGTIMFTPSNTDNDHVIVCTILDHLLLDDLDDGESDYDENEVFTDGCTGRHQQFWHDMRTLKFA